MSDHTTELTLVPKAPPAAPPPAPARGAASAPPAAAPSAAAPLVRREAVARRHEQRLEFTGTGGDYFRVWILNTLLTLATLGVYSAWAKRRKARWFARHTLLAGEPFDYHGDPRRLLAGRLFALALLAALVEAFGGGSGLGAGVALVAACFAIGPLLFASARRFELTNTSWRGLRFGFHAEAADVYAACLPLLVAWTLVAAVVGLNLGPLADGLAALTVALLLPLAHGRLTRLLQGQARYGSLAVDFQLSLDAFYRLYLRLGVVLIGAGVVAGLLALGVSKGVALALGANGPTEARLATWLPLLALGIGWAVGRPIYVAGLQRLVWNSTRLAGGVDFACQVPTGTLLKTLLSGGALTLLTLGLYWPFLAVRVARLRVEGVTVRSDVPIERILVRTPPPRGRGGGLGRVAAADTAAGPFGLDIGW